ncbi:VWA domain-containing protein [Pseudomonas typographi]|uniref:VWA domain-containing protein n=1 Tax=Pseudomonas typographi TaxID=2715964 RepID=UPI0016864818|nr:VWA domain-containing protein [Pseudomonas typographi]MBD1587262.1 VWA domain-containing protein [Pseudomonas typographi]
MSEGWPQGLRLGWLLAVPLLLWLFVRLWRRRQRTGRWQALLPAAFHSALLGAGNGRGGRWPWVLLGLGWALAVLALLGPGWQRLEAFEQKPADPLVVMLQLTPDMLAADVAPNRLGQARRKLLDLLRSRGEAQTALIVYAGSAHVLVPLTNDLATAANLLDALKPSLMPVPGQRADLAVQKALALIAQAGQGQGRLLLIGSALSTTEREGIDQQLGRQSPPLLIIGVGSRDGAPVTLENGELLKDAEGAIMLPRLDANTLEAVARRHGGSYQGARLDDQDLRALGLLDAPRGPRSGAQAQRLDAWADQGYWLLLPLLLIAALGARRGWLLCLLPLLLASPRPAMASGWENLWLRPDQQGQRLLEAHRPAEAARHFTDRRWLGVALFEAGDYRAAAQRFSQGDSASDHYNRGTALARAGDLAAALQAYEQALQRQPDLAPALKNRDLVQHLLAQQKAAEAAQAAGPAKAANATAGPTEGGQPGAAAPAQGTPGTQAEAPAGASQPTAAVADPNIPGAATAGAQGAGAAEGSEATAATNGEPDSAAEQQQSLEQWLRQIPDDPSELLRQKFWYEQQQLQDTPP